MTLRVFLESLNQVIKDNPEALDMKVVYSIDEEGNAFHKVSNYPALGKYNKRGFDMESENPNAVCIN